jgi:hypothetical protein
LQVILIFGFVIAGIAPAILDFDRVSRSATDARVIWRECALRAFARA